MTVAEDTEDKTSGSPTLTVRPSMIIPAMTLGLTRDQITVEDETGGKTAIPLKSVTGLRLWFDPRRFQMNRFRASLTYGDNRRLDFTNISMRGFARWDDHSVDYVDYVAALMRAIAKKNKNAVFEKGYSSALWGVHVAINGILFVSLIGGGLWFLFNGGAVLGVAGLGLGIFYAPTIYRMIMRNRPGYFSPDMPPADVLPRI